MNQALKHPLASYSLQDDGKQFRVFSSLPSYIKTCAAASSCQAGAEWVINALTAVFIHTILVWTHWLRVS